MADSEAIQYEDRIENISEIGESQHTNGGNNEASLKTIPQVGLPRESVRDLEALGGDTEDDFDDDDYDDDSDESYDTGSLSGSYSDYNTSDNSDEEPEMQKVKKPNKFFKRFSLKNSSKNTAADSGENRGIEDDEFGPYNHQLAIMGEPYRGETPPLFHNFDTQVS